jgi:methionyl-tRNA formyltransferase
MIICIAGKNEVAIECMKFVIENFNFNVIGIVNSSDKGIDGYYKSYKKFLLEKKIDIVKLEDVYGIKNLYFFSIEFDKIININKFKSSNLFNIHFSLLPKYKGVYTSAWPILLDEKKSGVTLHKIDNGIDTGDIIDQIEFEMDKKETCDSLYKKYMYFGIEIFKKNLSKIIKNNFKSKKQDKLYSSYFSKDSIDYKNLTISLNKTAYEIGKQLRAFYCPAFQIPKVFNYEIIDYEILDQKSFGKSGQVIEDNENYLIISTIDYNIKLYKKGYK